MGALPSPCLRSVVQADALEVVVAFADFRVVYLDRIAWYNYAVYSLRAGDWSEAEKALAILKTIDCKNKETLELEKELARKKR